MAANDQRSAGSLQNQEGLLRKIREHFTPLKEWMEDCRREEGPDYQMQYQQELREIEQITGWRVDENDPTVTIEFTQDALVEIYQKCRDDCCPANCCPACSAQR